MHVSLEVGHEFDLIHASPPCQSYSTMTNRHASSEPELIQPLRQWLEATGSQYVIENVEGARGEMVNPVKLCGTMFGLATRRHRLFETSFPVWALACQRHTQDLVAVYGRPDGRLLWTRVDGSEYRAWSSIKDGQQALGIDWSEDWHQLREAIPPAYTEFIGSHLPVDNGGVG